MENYICTIKVEEDYKEEKEQLEQLLTITRNTIIKAVLHDLKALAGKPLDEYTDVDGRSPFSLEDIAADIVTREVSLISEGFKHHLSIPEDEYIDELNSAELDFRYSVLDEISLLEEYKSIIKN